MNNLYPKAQRGNPLAFIFQPWIAAAIMAAAVFPPKVTALADLA
ncbi:hypothetical protein [Thermomonas hydrothermalis]|nr:hypothetical protein [Thermomonas hydrothermalis]